MTSLTFKCNLSPKPATGVTGEPPFHAFVKCGILLMASSSSSCITVSAPLLAAGLVGGGSSWREAVAAPARSHEAKT